MPTNKKFETNFTSDKLHFYEIELEFDRDGVSSCWIYYIDRKTREEYNASLTFAEDNNNSLYNTRNMNDFHEIDEKTIQQIRNWAEDKGY